MKKNDRNDAISELIMRASIDVDLDVPKFLTMNAGVIAVDSMLSRMAESANEDHEYGYAVRVCMIAGLCNKILFDLTSEHDIQELMIESEIFKNKIHAN
jgi:hypothetical protein